MNQNSINFEVVDQLKSLDEETSSNVLKEVSQLYLDGFEIIYNEIISALSHNDLKTVSQLAHSFKSSSANLGAMRMYELLAEIEKASKFNETNKDLIPLVIEIKTEFDNIKGYYSQFLV